MYLSSFFVFKEQPDQGWALLISDPNLLGRANLANINQMSTYIYLAGPRRFNHVFRTLLLRIHSCHHEVWDRCCSQKNVGRSNSNWCSLLHSERGMKNPRFILDCFFVNIYVSIHSFLHSLIQPIIYSFIYSLSNYVWWLKLSWMLSIIIKT